MVSMPQMSNVLFQIKKQNVLALEWIRLNSLLLFEGAIIGTAFLWNYSAIAMTCDATLARLQRNEFVTGREILPFGNTDQPGLFRTYYIDLLARDFVTRLQSSPIHSQILEVGPGEGYALNQALRQRLLPEKAKLYAWLYSSENLNFEIWRGLKATQGENLKILVNGDVAAKANRNSIPAGSLNHIIDAYAAFSYVNPGEVIETYGHWLGTGGLVDTTFALEVMRLENGLPVFGPGLKIVDENDNDVTLEWFNNIQGFTLESTEKAKDRFFDLATKFEPLLSKKLTQEGPLHLKLYESIGAKPDSPMKIYIYTRQGNVFYKTPRETINPMQPIVLRRTLGPAIAPPLETLEFNDGRPPTRIYRWRRS